MSIFRFKLSHTHERAGSIGNVTGRYPDSVTAGVWHDGIDYSGLVAVLGDTGRFSGRFVNNGDWYQQTVTFGTDTTNPESNRPDWWRCDGCGHAVPFEKGGEMQLTCPHCGAQLPERYDQ